MKIRKNAFECTLQLRWSDQDLFGHLNNARIMTLIEEARIRAGRHVAAGEHEPSQQKVVRSQNTVFDKPINYTSDVTAKVWVSRIGNTSLTMCHELLQDGQRCVYSEAVLVVIDKTSGLPTPISERERELLAPVCQTPEQ